MINSKLSSRHISNYVQFVWSMLSLTSTYKLQHCSNASLHSRVYHPRVCWSLFALKRQVEWNYSSLFCSWKSSSARSLIHVASETIYTVEVSYLWSISVIPVILPLWRVMCNLPPKMLVYLTLYHHVVMAKSNLQSSID